MNRDVAVDCIALSHHSYIRSQTVLCEELCLLWLACAEKLLGGSACWAVLGIDNQVAAGREHIVEALGHGRTTEP